MFRPNEAEGEGVNFNNTIHKQYILQYLHGVHLSSPPIIEWENSMQYRLHDEESKHLDLDDITSIFSYSNHQKLIARFRLSEAEQAEVNIDNETHKKCPLDHSHGTHPSSPIQ